MIKNKWRLLAILAAASLSIAAISVQARSEVVDTQETNFAIRVEAHVKASPDIAFIALTHPEDWWSSGHSWSGDAANMSLQAKPGGCWCEALPDGGFVEHMRVIRVAPGHDLRMKGALGPLQALPLTGVMDWTVAPNPLGGTDIRILYSVSGNLPKGLSGWAEPVNGVLEEAIARLARHVDDPSKAQN